ncbi:MULTISPECIES: glycosyltransferase family 4 protein [Brevibacterium]|uniref:D-inositol 3-phosphate glycosyltransferase n=4 Tax=Bacteria TaxID=2 RepID=A0A2H1K0A7_9MICO|nr:glycosyltransferase family 1 protein [Brevibacterium casei]MDH5147805.1 glycosyltransferase family 1 protein [Brevibacterium casei]NJE67182.1 glycosyltransferase family 1 protein [Brevibacterium sp. LS14]SMX93227.1 phosphatidylinositol alpha 1,6-mannosyltransferase [Brevibacterium casei CIP 102111]VEW14049.1 GDP-mannose-dependent alpha-mannosyltransferase [Brevibacterium casei]
MNGVTHSLLRVLDHLSDRGDEVLVIAPGTRRDGPKEVSGAKIVRVPSIALPKYRRIRVAPGGVTRIRRLLERFSPDVVHLASPFVLGWRGVLAAQSLGLPTVAIYQTEVPAYAARYGMHGIEAVLWTHVRNLHQHASLTLAPSSYTIDQLRRLGVAEVDHWARGVDSTRFDPSHRSEQWRRSVAPNGERIIGFVGRLAAEKQVEDLAVLADIPDAKLVIVGDGPWRAKLERLLPSAHFTGFLGGDALAQAVASFDLMVAPGELETFCQTIQEAMASEVPVIAPARGGPLDLVDSSRTGWLYTPKDLPAMRAHVVDLLGDEAKRRAFGIAGREQVLSRSWKSVCSQLVGHYSRAIENPAPQVMGRSFTVLSWAGAEGTTAR